MEPWRLVLKPYVDRLDAALVALDDPDFVRYFEETIGIDVDAIRELLNAEKKGLQTKAPYLLEVQQVSAAPDQKVDLAHLQASGNFSDSGMRVILMDFAVDCEGRFVYTLAKVHLLEQRIEEATKASTKLVEELRGCLAKVKALEPLLEEYKAAFVERTLGQCRVSISKVETSGI